MILFESTGNGLSFSNWSGTYYNYKFIYGIMWNVIAFFVFTTLGLYFDNILP